MSPLFYQTRARFLRASQQRFTDWGEANNHRRVGAALSEFHDLFVLMSSCYQRPRWIKKPKPVWYRQEQLLRDRSDRWVGHTPYGRMFSKVGNTGRNDAYTIFQPGAQQRMAGREGRRPICLHPAGSRRLLRTPTQLVRAEKELATLKQARHSEPGQTARATNLCPKH